MTEKAKLTREQAKAIADLRKGNVINKHDIVEQHAKNPNDWFTYKVINGMPLDTLIRALYIGYEVEETEEEKVIRYFDVNLKMWKVDSENKEIFKDGFCTALLALGREDLWKVIKEVEI